MAHRCLWLSRGCCRRAPGGLSGAQQLSWSRGLAAHSPCPRLLHDHDQIPANRNNILVNVIAAYKRLFSQPPKGFEKYFPNGKKANEAKGSDGETKDIKPTNSQRPSRTGSGGGGSTGGGGKKGGKKEDAGWWSRLQKEPEKRFAHNHQYLSGMFDPVDEDIALKKSIEQSKEMWLSSKGFVFPGFKSSVECNMHPRMPDEARQLELTEGLKGTYKEAKFIEKLRPDVNALEALANAMKFISL